MKIRAGYDIAFNCFQEVPMLLMLSVHPSRQQAKALHSLDGSALKRMTGSDEAGIAIEKRRRFYCMVLLHLVAAVAAFLGTIMKRWHHRQMAHVLWQQRCLEVASRLHHVGVVDETRRTYRHHGRQRDAPRRIATLRIAPHRYATLEPLGKPGGSRAFSADGPLNRLWLRDAYRSQREAETEEI